MNLGVSLSRLKVVRYAVLLTLITGPAFGQDLDVPRAQQKYNLERTEADRAKTLFEREVQINNGLNAAVNNANSREDTARNELDRAKSNLSNIDREISNSQTEISELKFDRDRFVRQRADASRDLPELKRRPFDQAAPTRAALYSSSIRSRLKRRRARARTRRRSS